MTIRTTMLCVVLVSVAFLLARCSPSSPPPAAGPSSQVPPPAQREAIPPAAAVAPAITPAPVAAKGGPIKSPSGLEYSILTEGIGATPPLGSTVKIHLTGWRLSDNAVFMDTRKTGVPREYKLTTLELIKGLVESLQAMRTGEKRRVKVPHGLGYGVKGMPEVVPSRTDLDFEIELVSFVPPGTAK